MIKFENTEVMGWEAAIRGMRNQMKYDIWLSNEEVKNLERGGFITLTQPDGLRITITYDRPEYEESEDE